MTQRSVHQIVIGAGPGDAITSMAIALRDGLRTEFTSEIYAYHLDQRVSDQVLPLAQAPTGSRRDVLIYHASFGIPQVTRWLLGRRERIIMIYHNITPWDLFIDSDPEFAAGLYWGRHELELMRERAVLTIAVSEFNRRDLLALAYRDVEVAAAGLVPSRLRRVRPDVAMAARVRTELPDRFVLTVSQVLPHKRVERLIQAMHLVQWVHQLTVGLVVVGHQRLPNYARALHRQTRELNVRDVWFTGGLTDAELAVMYRAASVYATASAHEGLAVPPLEAMSFGVPVVALGSGALPDTLGSAALVLPEDAGPPLLAEAIVESLQNCELRAELVRRGAARISALEADDPIGRCVALISRHVGRR